QRPGRIDLAVEVPLPDAPARRKLLALYGPAIRLTEAEAEAVVAETEGVAASFFAEMARRAELLTATAVVRAGADGAAGIEAVRAALAELRSSREALASSGVIPAGPRAGQGWPGAPSRLAGEQLTERVGGGVDPGRLTGDQAVEDQSVNRVEHDSGEDAGPPTWDPQIHEALLEQS